MPPERAMPPASAALALPPQRPRGRARASGRSARGLAGDRPVLFAGDHRSWDGLASKDSKASSTMLMWMSIAALAAAASRASTARTTAACSACDRCRRPGARNCARRNGVSRRRRDRAISSTTLLWPPA